MLFFKKTPPPWQGAENQDYTLIYLRLLLLKYSNL